LSRARWLVRLSPPEKFGGLHGDVRIPLSAVRSVTVDAGPWSALRGIRAPDGGSGVIMLGTRRYPGGEDLAALYGSRPVVLVDLDDTADFGRPLATVRDPQATAAQILGALS
jgi:hypothetical protein